MTSNSRIIAYLEFMTAAGLFLFWTAFFTVGISPDNPPAGYLPYEHAFPVADILLSAGFTVSGILLLRGRSEGRIFSLACSGALMFLGVLDVSFNLQNGMYLLSVSDGVTNVFINLWCIGIGGFLIRHFSKDIE
jgi:hypothetical protein